VVLKTLKSVKAPPQTSLNGRHPRAFLAKEIPIITNPAIDAHIVSLRATYADMLTQRELITHTSTHFGKNFLINNGMPIKGIVEATIQLASRLCHGSEINKMSQVLDIKRMMMTPMLGVWNRPSAANLKLSHKYISVQCSIPSSQIVQGIAAGIASSWIVSAPEQYPAGSVPSL
jgi:hypothetical protein